MRARVRGLEGRDILNGCCDCNAIEKQVLYVLVVMSWKLSFLEGADGAK